MYTYCLIIKDIKILQPFTIEILSLFKIFLFENLICVLILLDLYVTGLSVIARICLTIKAYVSVSTICALYLRGLSNSDGFVTKREAQYNIAPFLVEQ